MSFVCNVCCYSVYLTSLTFGRCCKLDVVVVHFNKKIKTLTTAPLCTRTPYLYRSSSPRLSSLFLIPSRPSSFTLSLPPFLCFFIQQQHPPPTLALHSSFGDATGHRRPLQHLQRRHATEPKPPLFYGNATIVDTPSPSLAGLELGVWAVSEKFEEVIRETEVRGVSLLADMLEAAKTGIKEIASAQIFRLAG